MSAKDYYEKDFYKELGVTSDATKDEIKRAARKVLADNHPDRNPNNPAAEERYKAATEAKEILTDDTKRAEYDETRRLFASGGFGRRFSGGGFLFLIVKEQENQGQAAYDQEADDEGGDGGCVFH